MRRLKSRSSDGLAWSCSRCRTTWCLPYLSPGKLLTSNRLPTPRATKHLYSLYIWAENLNRRSIVIQEQSSRLYNKCTYNIRLIQEGGWPICQSTSDPVKFSAFFNCCCCCCVEKKLGFMKSVRTPPPAVCDVAQNTFFGQRIAWGSVGK